MSSRKLDICPRFRGILFDWLVEVAVKFKSQQETLFLTLALVDRYLSPRAAVTRRNELQLIGVTGGAWVCRNRDVHSVELVI